MGGLALSRGLTVRTDILIQDYQERSASLGLHAWDPRLKLALLVLAVALNVGLALGWLSLFLFLTSVGLVIWSRIPFKLFALFFLAPAWATLVVFLGFSVGFGTSPLCTLGPLTLYREGVLLGLSAAARVASDMSWMAAVFLTTPFTKVLEALKWFRIPTVLVETVALAYRYTFVLIEEFYLMRDAARLRGGLQNYRHSVRATALILAEVILRAYDRARRIQGAMVSRGAASKGVEPMSALTDSTACPNRCDVTPLFVDRFAPLVTCSHLSFSYPYPAKTVVEDLSLSVSAGEVVAVCGPNGSGKTTLLKLLAGMLAPTQGEIFLSGRRLERKNRNEAFRHVGILLQDPNDQLFCTHVQEDIAYGPQNLGLEAEEVERLVQTAMDLMEVGPLAERPIHRLSHGEMKRVGLAGLIAMRPPLILLDEPTAGLDPVAARELVRLIRHLNSHHGYTFVLVTHAIDIAPLLATRMVILDQGRITADGSLRSILTDGRLLEGARLEPPLLTRLFQRISADPSGQDDIPITIEEAAARLAPGLVQEDSTPGLL